MDWKGVGWIYIQLVSGLKMALMLKVLFTNQETCFLRGTLSLNTINEGNMSDLSFSAFFKIWF